MKNIEVEVRGPLTETQYKSLMKKFEKEGEFIEDKNRTAICYPDPQTGSLVEDCNIDIRVRNTNGTPELIVKQGKWGAVDESRREFSLIGKEGQFNEMIEMLALMGFDKGVAVVRRGKVFKYQGVEFSLVEVPGHSFFFEAEIMTGEGEKKKALKEIVDLCRTLGLELFSEQGFYDYINVLNKEANKEFTFEDFSKTYFEDNF